MQKALKVNALATSADAVLSQSPPQPVDHFTASELDAFDQAHHHPHIRQHRRRRQTRLVEHHPFQSRFTRHRRCVAGERGAGMPACGSRLRRHPLGIESGLRLHGPRNLVAVAAAVEPLLLRPAGRRSVVGGAPSAGTLPTMVLPAAERTTQVPPTCISRMREKTNPAVRAVRYAPLKLGMGLQHRVQHGLIVLDKRPGAIELMPICAKREKLLDGDGKKARLSAILSIVVDTPSSYLFEANASRGRARFFMRDGQGPGKTARTNDPLPIAHPDHPACRVDADSLRVRS